MIANTALPQLTAIQWRIYALLDKVPHADRYAVYAAMFRADHEFTFTGRLAKLQAIEIDLKVKAQS